MQFCMFNVVRLLKVTYEKIASYKELWVIPVVVQVAIFQGHTVTRNLEKTLISQTILHQEKSVVRESSYTYDKSLQGSLI